MALEIAPKDIPKEYSETDIKRIYNPLDEDFTHAWDGKPFTIPAKGYLDTTEALAMHLAKHLAQYIVYKGFALKMEMESVGQITPDTAKPVPKKYVKEVMEALVASPAEAAEARRKYEVVRRTTLPVEMETKTTFEPKGIKAEVIEKKEEEKEEGFVCEICGFEAKSAAGLKAHQRIHKK